MHQMRSDLLWLISATCLTYFVHIFGDFELTAVKRVERGLVVSLQLEQILKENLTYCHL